MRPGEIEAQRCRRVAPPARLARRLQGDERFTAVEADNPTPERDRCAMSLDGVTMGLAAAAANSALADGLVMRFEQRDSTVIGRYSGGGILAGFLVGKLTETALAFRYVQADRSGRVDSGVSEGVISITQDGRRRLTEHFTWISRDGGGTNIFEEGDPKDVRLT